MTRPVWDLTRWQKMKRLARDLRCIGRSLTDPACERVRKAAWWIGRRGAVQLAFGLLYIVLGVTYWRVPRTPAGKQTLKYAIDVMPIQYWGLAWTTAGAVCIAVALFSKPGHDARGWNAAVALPTIWTLFYMFAAVGGQNLAWSSCGIFGLLAAIAIINSGWPNPPHYVEERTEC